MLNEDVQEMWEEWLLLQAVEMDVPESEREAFVGAAIFGIKKYSLALMKRIHRYGVDVMTPDLDADTWITDSSVRMFIQIVEPNELIK